MDGEKILILPAFGEMLHNCASIIMFLKEIGYRPTTIGCTSSGSILGAVACSSGFENTFNDYIRRFLSKLYTLNSKNYIKSYKLRSFSSGTMFQRGTDIPLSIIDFEFMRQPRLIISAYNIQTDETELFTTKPISSITTKSIDTIEDLTSIIRASMTLPGILPEYKMRDNTYYDSSVSGPSIIRELSELYSCYMNIIYISPKSTKLFNDRSFLGLLSGYRRNKLKEDIQFILDKLNKFPGILCENEGSTLYELRVAIEKGNSSIASLIVIYPNSERYINFTTLNKGELSRSVNQSYDEGFTFLQYFKTDE